MQNGISPSLNRFRWRMFRSNNPTIDTNILAERARVELARARPVSPEQTAEAAHVDTPASLTVAPPINAPASSSVAPTMGNRLEGNWLRRIPLLFDFLSWASWIIRVRKIARMAFTLEANLSETRANLEANLSETRLEIDHLGQQFRSLETNFEAHLGAFFVASMENTRTIDALRVEIDALRSQNV